MAVRRGLLAGAAVNRLVQKLGLLPIRLHDLCPCAATLSLAAGVHMKAIQVLLGHSSFKLTADTYTSVLPQLEVEAADAPVALVPRKAAQQGGQGGDEPPQGPQLVPAAEPTAPPAPAAPRSSDAAGAEVHPMVGPAETAPEAADEAPAA
ncbi:integrase [Streptomyces sparsogenes]|uniref:integrase n=1 Tax=Streptomyces sparsogenes TaxID=67365 RepID=UPI0033D8B43E